MLRSQKKRGKKRVYAAALEKTLHIKYVRLSRTAAYTLLYLFFLQKSRLKQGVVYYTSCIATVLLHLKSTTFFFKTLCVLHLHQTMLLCVFFVFIKRGMFFIFFSVVALVCSSQKPTTFSSPKKKRCYCVCSSEKNT